MRAVGLRELKNRLSEYVRHVREGEEVLVTDRGAVVAVLGPPGRVSLASAVPAGLGDLVARGLLTVGASNDAGAYPKMSPILGTGRAAELLDQERGPR